MKKVKQVAGKGFSQERVSLTNDNYIYPRFEPDVEDSKKFWGDMKYKMVREKWKKLAKEHANEDGLQSDRKPIQEVYDNLLIPRPQSSLTTSRKHLHIQDHAAPVDPPMSKKASPSVPVSVPSKKIEIRRSVPNLQVLSENKTIKEEEEEAPLSPTDKLRKSVRRVMNALRFRKISKRKQPEESKVVFTFLNPKDYKKASPTPNIASFNNLHSAMMPVELTRLSKESKTKLVGIHGHQLLEESLMEPSKPREVQSNDSFDDEALRPKNRTSLQQGKHDKSMESKASSRKSHRVKFAHNREQSFNSDIEEDHHNERLRQSEMFVKQNSINRKKLGNSKLGRDIVKAIQEDEFKKKYLKEFFMSLGIILTSNKVWAFKVIKHLKKTRAGGLRMANLKRLNSMEINPNSKLIKDLFEDNTRGTRVKGKETGEKSNPKSEFSRGKQDQGRNEGTPPRIEVIEASRHGQLDKPTIFEAAAMTIPSATKIFRNNRRGSHRDVTLPPSAPSHILSDFAKRVLPMMFYLKDSKNLPVHLKIEAYLLDDMLNKEKFFVALKFTEIQRQVWARTRLGLDAIVINQTGNPNLREWIVVEKALEKAGMDTLGARNREANSIVLGDNGRDEWTVDEKLRVKRVMWNILQFAGSKYCFLQKMIGRSFGVLTPSLRMVIKLKHFFKEKYHKQVIEHKNYFIRLPPVSWQILQLMIDKQQLDDDVEPVEGTFGPLVDLVDYMPARNEVGEEDEEEDNFPFKHFYSPMKVLSFARDASPRSAMIPIPEEEFGHEISEFKPHAFDANRTGIRKIITPIAVPTRGILQFGQGKGEGSDLATRLAMRLVSKDFKGWCKVSVPEKTNLIHSVQTQIVTLITKISGKYWMSHLEIEGKTGGELHDDIAEDFDLKMTQFYYPYRTDRVWTVKSNMLELPASAGIPRRTLTRFVGSRLSGSRVSRPLYDRVTSALREFYGSLLVTSSQGD